MKNSSLKGSFFLALFGTVLALVVIVFGAYTRLTDAGLGCPDWPGCYGTIVPHSSATKAWTEMIHRYLAGALTLVIFALALLAIRNRRLPKQPILLPSMLVAVILFQALLGMWTVTLKLFPLVVMAHLLGGLTTFSLLGWLALTLNPTPKPIAENFFHANTKKLKGLRIWAAVGLCVLIAQLFLGGWTSANYAALVCLDFPFCSLNQTYHFNLFNLSEAFNLTSAGVTGSIGEPLDSAALMTIHMLHRIGALLTILIIGSLALLTFLHKPSFFIRMLSVAMASLLIFQILLGIMNVLALLPLSIAVSHNAVAALLLLALVALNYYLYLKPKADLQPI